MKGFKFPLVLALSLALAGSLFGAEGTDGLPKEFLAASGTEFCLIEPGVFMMGNDLSTDEILRKYPGGQAESLNTAVRRRATLTTAFYMAKYPVTVGDFRRFVQATGYRTTAEQKGSGRGVDATGTWVESAGLNWQEPGFEQTSKDPVVCVSYYDALEYVNWLNATAVEEPELGGTPRYALPTETQWEYAARAGSSSEFFWGDDASEGAKYLNAADESGNASGRKWAAAFPFDDGFAATSPVGSFEPNAWGLYDALGNVWEWCADRFGTYPSTPVVDPQGAALGEYRVLRGGGWDAAPALARCAYRGANLPDARNANYGFRVALIPPPRPTVAPEPVAPSEPEAEPNAEDPVAVEAPESPVAESDEPSAETSSPTPTPVETDPLKRKIANLGLAVLAGEKLIGDESVTRALQSIQKDDYREASTALKSGEELSDVLRKKIKMAALLATLGQNSLDESVPNFDLMPSVAKDRVMLLGSLAFVGLELLKEDEPKEQP